jgi:hypothetical protein
VELDLGDARAAVHHPIGEVEATVAVEALEPLGVEEVEASQRRLAQRGAIAAIEVAIVG